jgi:hypothetical protein
MAQNKKLRDQTQEHAKYLAALNHKLDKILGLVAHQGEALAAIVAHLGEDVIVAKIADMKAARHQKHELELEQSVQFGLDNGLFVLAPEGSVITADSFVVGDEVSPDGTKTRIQHEVKRFDKEGQARYLGKKVGDEMTREGFPTKVVVRAIYSIDLAKVSELAAKRNAEASAHAVPTLKTQE